MNLAVDKTFGPVYLFSPRCLKGYWRQHITRVSVIHFKVTGANVAGFDLVLMQPFLLYYVNSVILMLTSIFSTDFHKKRKEVKGQPQPHVHSEARVLSS